MSFTSLAVAHEIAAFADSMGCPPTLRRSIERYASGEVPHVGSFLTAVLENDLRAAVRTADPFNRFTLRAIVDYVQETCPPESWGSPAAVRAWRERHRTSSSSPNDAHHD